MEAEDVNVQDFYVLADAMHKTNFSWRWGQTLFNTLLMIRPDLAEKVRATDSDPFYASNSPTDVKLFNFAHFMKDNLSARTQKA